MRVWNYGADEPTAAVNTRDINVAGRQGRTNVGNLDIASDGETVVYSYFDSEVVHWNLELSGPLYSPLEFRYDKPAVSKVKVYYSADDRYIYYHAMSSKLYIFWIAFNRFYIKDLGDTQIDHIAFHPNNKWLAYSLTTPDAPYKLIIADVFSLATRSETVFDDMMRAFAFSPDGQYVAVGGGNITLWRISE